MALEHIDIDSRYSRSRDGLDRERLAKLKAIRGKRNKPKNHATSKEVALLARRKHAERVTAEAAWVGARRNYVAAVKAYFLGKGNHP